MKKSLLNHTEMTPDSRPGRAWQGRFGYPDTSALLSTSPNRFTLRRLKEKRWCYIGVFHPDIILGCAIVHLGYICSAFAFAFDRINARMIEHNFVLPPLGQVRYDRSPEKGICRFRNRSDHLYLSHQPDPHQPHQIRSRLGSGKNRLRAEIDLNQPAARLFPMHFLMPMNANARAFTTKAAGYHATGFIEINNDRIELDPDTSFAVLDWTNGFYPRKTFWNWACGAGRTEKNDMIGFNFSRGVYRYGRLENVIWMNGRPFQTGPVVFEYNSRSPMVPWKIHDPNGTFSMIFRPEGIRSADENFGLVQSRFIQPCGTYEGWIKTGSGEKTPFKNITGVAEEHFAKW